MQIGDIGAHITFTVSDDAGAIDLTGATQLSMYLRAPSGAVKTVTPALLDAANGRVRYTTISGDLDEVGNWQAQVGYALGSFVGRTSIVTFPVSANL